MPADIPPFFFSSPILREKKKSTTAHCVSTGRAFLPRLYYRVPFVSQVETAICYSMPSPHTRAHVATLSLLLPLPSFYRFPFSGVMWHLWGHFFVFLNPTYSNEVVESASFVVNQLAELTAAPPREKKKEISSLLCFRSLLLSVL